MSKQFDPPAHLSNRAKTLWKALVPSRVRSLGRLTLFQAALEALDRADSAREAIATAGMTTKTETTGAVHVHPLVKVERESRQQFGRLWSDIGLQWNQCEDGIDFERWQANQEKSK